jgi:hypothetical protein
MAGGSGQDHSAGRLLRHSLRWITVCVAVIIFSIMAVKTLRAYQESKGKPAEVRLFDDSAKESLPIRLDASRNLFQVGLLLAGGLWALYLGKTTETRVDLTQPPELILFLLCNACFLVSFYSQYTYTVRVADWINSGVPKGDKIEIPDIDAKRLLSVLNRQHDFFLGGAALALFTLLSGRYLRDERDVKPPNDKAGPSAVASGPGCAQQTVSSPGAGGTAKIPGKSQQPAHPSGD